MYPISPKEPTVMFSVILTPDIYPHQDICNNMGLMYPHQDICNNMGLIYPHKDICNNMGLISPS